MSRYGEKGSETKRKNLKFINICNRIATVSFNHFDCPLLTLVTRQSGSYPVTTVVRSDELVFMKTLCKMKRAIKYGLLRESPISSLIHIEQKHWTSLSWPTQRKWLPNILSTLSLISSFPNRCMSWPGKCGMSLIKWGKVSLNTPYPFWTQC